MTTYMVKGETHEGAILTLRKGFPSHEAAEDHPVTLSLWKRVWVEADSRQAPKPKEPTLPPFPWNWVSSGASDASGQFHAYLIDANGRKIAAIWGAGSAKKLVADFIVDACNTLHEVENDMKIDQ
jgi:hypothetical protein